MVWFAPVGHATSESVVTSMAGFGGPESVVTSPPDWPVLPIIGGHAAVATRPRPLSDIPRRSPGESRFPVQSAAATIPAALML